MAPAKLKTSLPAIHSEEASSLLRGGGGGERRGCVAGDLVGGEAGPPGAGEEGEPQEWKGALPRRDWQAGRGGKVQPGH